MEPLRINTVVKKKNSYDTAIIHCFDRTTGMYELQWHDGDETFVHYDDLLNNYIVVPEDGMCMDEHERTIILEKGKVIGVQG